MGIWKEGFRLSGRVRAFVSFIRRRFRRAMIGVSKREGQVGKTGIECNGANEDCGDGKFAEYGRKICVSDGTV